jgi:hypothetical protein
MASEAARDREGVEGEPFVGPVAVALARAQWGS